MITFLGILRFLEENEIFYKDEKANKLKYFPLLKRHETYNFAIESAGEKESIFKYSLIIKNDQTLFSEGEVFSVSKTKLYITIHSNPSYNSFHRSSTKYV